jgi:hypothetical protein
VTRIRAQSGRQGTPTHARLAGRGRARERVVCPLPIHATEVPAGLQFGVADTFAALAGELDLPGADSAALAQAHTTPGGLNEQFARDLEAAGTYDAVQVGLGALLARITEK